MKNYSITIARSLELEDIRSGGGFEHANVVDMRRTECGATRPIEESVLKRLKNHFVGYEQLECEDENLMRQVSQNRGDTLVLTDDISHVASLCHAHEVPFASKSFYVVETGMGDFIRTVPAPQTFEPRFGTFVG